MLDIDDFKRVNDVYGHGAGDEVLRGLADTLRTPSAPSDVVCRLGGEEFAIVIAVARAGERGAAGATGSSTASSRRDFDPAGRITDLGRPRRGPEHAMNPRELDRVRRGGDDDREGARQEPDRPLRRERAGAPEGSRCRRRATCARSRT